MPRVVCIDQFAVRGRPNWLRELGPILSPVGSNLGSLCEPEHNGGVDSAGAQWGVPRGAGARVARVDLSARAR